MTPGRAAERDAYSQPLRLGRYERSSGLFGKYDNVRRLWEDQVTGHFLRPSLETVLRKRRSRGAGLRVLDLGCGAGDGYDLITRVGPPGCIEEYVGLDINDDLLADGARRLAPGTGVCLLKADLTAGLPNEILHDHQGFDLYFSSYGMLSHLTDRQLVGLLEDVCAHAAEHAVFVGDWLGQYSYEWSALWRHAPEPDYFMDYRMSYLYTPEERREADIPSFPLRLMTPGEVLRLVGEASQKARRSIRPVVTFDRSIFVGRHTDTAEYNPAIPSLRSLVNSLLERDRHTDIEGLLVEFIPRPDFDRINHFHRRFFEATNELVRYAADLFERLDEAQTGSARTPEPGVAWTPKAADGPATRPTTCGPTSTRVPLCAQTEPTAACVADAVNILWAAALTIERAGRTDDRVNVLEPALADGLRRLEIGLQEGLGAGHGLGVILFIAGFAAR